MKTVQERLAFVEEQLGKAIEFYDTGRVSGASFYEARDQVRDLRFELAGYDPEEVRRARFYKKEM